MLSAQSPASGCINRKRLACNIAIPMPMPSPSPTKVIQSESERATKRLRSHAFESCYKCELESVVVPRRRCYGRRSIRHAHSIASLNASRQGQRQRQRATSTTATTMRRQSAHGSCLQRNAHAAHWSAMTPPEHEQLAHTLMGHRWRRRGRVIA